MTATYDFEVKGKSPLLIHRDNITGQELIKKWQNDPLNAKSQAKGDDRSPAWLWQTYLYTSEHKIVVTSAMLMASLRRAGAMVVVPGGKHGKTFKDATQYGLLPHEESYPLLIGGAPVETAAIDALWGDNDFDKHLSAVAGLGFELSVIRAKISQSKHIRVRPQFNEWGFRGSFDVTEDAITDDILGTILNLAGDRCGIGDWRPGCKTPGPYGRFDVTLNRVG